MNVILTGCFVKYSLSHSDQIWRNSHLLCHISVMSKTKINTSIKKKKILSWTKISQVTLLSVYMGILFTCMLPKPAHVWTKSWLQVCWNNSSSSNKTFSLAIDSGKSKADIVLTELHFFSYLSVWAFENQGNAQKNWTGAGNCKNSCHG